ALRPAEIHRDVLAFDISCFLQSLTKRCHSVVFAAAGIQKPDNRHRRLLRPRNNWPRRRTADERDELAPPHSITSSARASKVSGTVRPSALAVVMFMMRSNLVGCSTGISAGFAPRRILSTKSAARRNKSGKLAP